MAAITSKDERNEFQRAQDAADLAEAQAVVARTEPKIPNHHVGVLLDLDDATFADVIAEFWARGEDGIPEEESMTMARVRSARSNA